MSKAPSPRIKFVVFAVVPVCALLLAAETAVRLRYFVAHGYEWAYLTAPFGAARFAPANKEDLFKIPEAAPAASGAAALSNATVQGAGATQQMVIKWSKPCADTMVFSTELQKPMPRTFDENCFRGDRISMAKGPDEYRIIFLGGSAVEDFQSDAEMMTNQFKAAIPPTQHGKGITVVNAGRVTFESRRIASYYRQTVSRFSPDLVLYYEAGNEQPRDAQWARVDDRLARFRTDLHKALYYRSMLYTYVLEKFAFLTTSHEHFWKIDPELLRKGWKAVIDEVRSSGARLVFVTQAYRFPRMWKGVDTFDYRAVDVLLDRLKADPQYVYNVTEISALNQRLTVGLTIDMCRRFDVPVLNILDAVEALGETTRAQMFMDLSHMTVEGDKIVGELIASQMPLSE